MKPRKVEMLEASASLAAYVKTLLRLSAGVNTAMGPFAQRDALRRLHETIEANRPRMTAAVILVSDLFIADHKRKLKASEKKTPARLAPNRGREGS